MQFSKEQALSMYEDLVFSRKMGDKIVEYIFGGRINGAIHPCLGQEAISSAILATMRLTSHQTYRHCTHRQQPLIAKSIGLDPFLGELMNKRTGMMHGTSGEYHLVSLKDGHLPMIGILGAGVETSTGFAWALQKDGADAVVICSFGDGAMSQGSTYESINMAAINHLPIVYLIENNQVAMSTPNCDEAPFEDLYRRAAGYNIPGVQVDGNDIEAMTNALLSAVELAANGQPNMLEAKTWRWQGHYVGDMQERYRSTEFLKHLDGMDPVKLYEQKLLDRGFADQPYFDKVHDEQLTLLSDAFERAVAQELPTKEECVNYNNIYSNDAGGAL